MDEIGTGIEVFATGLQMGESPRWHDGRFWMCDWLAGEVLVFDADGSREVVARVDGMPFSIDWLPDSRLVVTTPDGVVAGADLTPYGAPGVGFDELVVTDDGLVHVDRPGSLPWEERLPGIVGLVTPDGSLTDRRVAEGGEVVHTVDVGQPAFSCVLGGDDGRTLHVVANDHSEHGVGHGRVLRVRV